MSAAVYVLVGWVALSLAVTAGLALVLRGRTMFNPVPVPVRQRAAAPALQYAGRDGDADAAWPAAERPAGRSCG